MNSLGELVVAITGDTSQLNVAIDSSRKKTESFAEILSEGGPLGKAILQTGTMLTKLATNPIALCTGAIIGIGKAFIDTTKELVEYGAKIQETSERTGLSTKALQEYKYVAEQTGGSLETITAAIKMMTRGLETNKGTFAALGIQLKDNKGNFLSTTQIFEETIGKLGDMTNDTERTNLALKLFGRGALDMVPLLKEGSKGIEELKNKAHDLGLVMSDETIVKAHNLEKATDSLKATWKVFTMSLVEGALPGLVNITNGLLNLMMGIRTGKSSFDIFIQQMEKIRESADKIIGPVTDLTRGNKLSGEQIANLVKLYPDLTGVMDENNTTLEQANKLVDDQIQKQAQSIITKEISLQNELTKAKENNIKSLKSEFGITEEQAQQIDKLGTILRRQIETKQNSTKAENDYKEALRAVGIDQLSAGGRILMLTADINYENRAILESKDHMKSAQQAIYDLSTEGQAAAAKKKASSKQEAELDAKINAEVKKADDEKILQLSIIDEKVRTNQLTENQANEERNKEYQKHIDALTTIISTYHLQGTVIEDTVRDEVVQLQILEGHAKQTGASFTQMEQDFANSQNTFIGGISESTGAILAKMENSASDSLLFIGGEAAKTGYTLAKMEQDFANTHTKTTDKNEESWDDYNKYVEDTTKQIKSNLKQNIEEGLTDIGRALVSGESGWTNLGKLALESISMVLQGIGKELIALAAADIGLNHDYAGAIVAAAGATAAFVASGVIDGLANQMGQVATSATAAASSVENVSDMVTKLSDALPDLSNSITPGLQSLSDLVTRGARIQDLINAMYPTENQLDKINKERDTVLDYAASTFTSETDLAKIRAYYANEYDTELKKEREAVETTADKIKDAYVLAADAIKGQLTSIQNDTLSFANSLADIGKDIGTNLIENIKSGASKADFISFMGDYIKNAILQMAVMGGMSGQLSTIGAEIATSLQNGTMGQDASKIELDLSNLYDTAKSATSATMDIINSVFPKVVTSTGSTTGSTSNVPVFASGGIVMPTPGGIVANIAEGNQPEIIFPLDKLQQFISTGNTSGSSGSSDMVHLIVQMDSKPFLDTIFPATKNRTIKISAGAVV